MADNYNIIGTTQKTKTEISWRWDTTKAKSQEACIECLFLIKNPYDHQGQLNSLEYSLDNGATRMSATVLPASDDHGVGADAFDLNAKTKQISVWWFAGYDLRIMRTFNDVKLYAQFKEVDTGDETEEREISLTVDLRPSGHFSVITPRSNDRYFDLKFLAKETITPGSLHFTVEIDTVDTFDSEDLQVLSTRLNPLEWLCDGAAFPDEGVTSDQDHIIQYNAALLGDLTEGEYHFRITADFDQFYPVITYPVNGQVFISETIDVVGHITVLDEMEI